MTQSMKTTKLIILASLLLLTGKVSAQFNPPTPVAVEKYKVLDSAYLKCTYRLTSVKDTSDAGQKKSGLVDMQVLQIGNDMSKYFSQYAIDYDKEIQKMLKKGANSFPNSLEYGTYGYEIFKNNSDKYKITVTDLGTHLGANSFGPCYQYEDELSDMKWKIEKDTSTILTYKCQKAVTEFRGRSWEAWFTSEIPINNGPWKFGGLPGLIIKVSDSQQYFVFECIGIKNLKKKEPIKFYTLKYIKIARKDLQKLYKKFHEDNATFKTMLGISSMFVDPVTNELKDISHTKIVLPYNPIELK
jgi:GLPGLI family protein